VQKRRSLLSRVRRTLALRTRLRGAIQAVRAATRPKQSSQEAVLLQEAIETLAPILEASVLFDSDWYAHITDRDRTKRAAVEHYLTEGRSKRLTPHPLFDPAYFGQQHAAVIGHRDPLVYYLSEPASRKASPHPLFDAQAYVARTPAAGMHPLGPLGHYMEVGASNGLAPNDWYTPDPLIEPNGLADWVRAHANEWLARERGAAPTWQPELSAEDSKLAREKYAGFAPQRDDNEGVLVSVVLLAGDELSLLKGMVDSVCKQTVPDWELLVVHHGEDSEVAATLGPYSKDQRIRILRQGAAGTVPALNLGSAAATGRFLAWLSAGDRWEQDRLRLALAAFARPGVDAVYDVVELTSSGERLASPTGDGKVQRRTYSALESSPERIAAGWHPELGALVVRRALADQIGEFDESLPAAAGHDFVLRLAARTSLSFIPIVGVRADSRRRQRSVSVRSPRERPSLDSSGLETWHDVVLGRNLIDWAVLAERKLDPRKVSVVIPANDDWRLASSAVRSIAEAAASSDLAVQIIVVNNGCRLTDSVVLDSLPLRFDGVRIVTSAVDHGFALGSNIALPDVEGTVVVFLHDDTEVRPGWLEPLVAALADPTVLGVQSLLVNPGGSIQSAGIAFPSCGGVPHVLLQGFPVEDARSLAAASFSAVTAAAMAVRFVDVVALRGFDPLFRNGMEDVDFGLRMKQLKSGSFRVQPRSIVVHHDSQTPERLTESLTNHRILLDRWGKRMPGDDVELWRHVGFEVVRHEATVHLSEDRRLTPPQPVLRRLPCISADEQRPALRWAIKNPAPNDPSAEFWGDTHFARQLAAALRSLGQEVVIDHRPEFERQSGRFDDVVLVLRGLAPYRPQYTQINLAWLISHPDMLRRDEASSYDRLFAASVTWADRMSKAWSIRIDPLLQATDPTLFHPDRARPDSGHPVLFVGSSRRKLRPIVRDAIDAGLPLAIFGREWQGLVPDSYVKAEYLPNDAVGEAYRAAGVVLNDHWGDMRVEGFVSNRLFDAAASGARIITDEVTGLGDIFGRSVQVARTRAELARLASAPDLDSVFGDDQERRGVAARIHAEHSFVARAQQLLDTAIELRSEFSDSRRDEARALAGVD
jgi:GT2 family glycosyltransferase